MAQRPATVILVDDDLSIRRAFRRLLSVAGYKVQVFGSADAFLASGPVRRPACLVIDVRMPGKSGFDLHDCLTASGTFIPTIFISAHEDPATEVRARQVGAAGFLPKPFAADALFEAIDRAILLDRRDHVEAGEGST